METGRASMSWPAGSSPAVAWTGHARAKRLRAGLLGRQLRAHDAQAALLEIADLVAQPSGGRQPAVCRAREGVAYLWVEVLGRSAPPLMAALGVRPPSIYRAAARGRAAAARWRQLLGE
jgi:hypothetical protein